MRTRSLTGILILLGLLVLACNLSQPQVTTVEVTRIVRETRVVTVEVTRIVRKPVLVTPTPPLEITVEGLALWTPRAHHTATRLQDGRILLVGGSQGPDEFLDEVEIFNPQYNLIDLGASLHTARHDHTATLLNDGRVLVVGGYSLPRQWLRDAELYDPAKDTWMVVPPLYSHGVGHTATLLGDGRVLVVGGTIGSGAGSGTDRAEVFDPATLTWVEVMPLDYARSSHTAQLLTNGTVLVAGGGGENDTLRDGDALIYNPQTNLWAATSDMLQPRLFAQSVRLDDGRVLVAGGAVSSSPAPRVVPNAEIYDPVSKTWTAAALLSEPRYAFALSLLPDGRVLAVGGARNYDNEWSERSFISLIEVYDPHLDRWCGAGDILQPSAYPAAVLLSDGRVWLTGGQYSNAFFPYTWLIGPIPAYQ